MNSRQEQSNYQPPRGLVMIIDQCQVKDLLGEWKLVAAVESTCNQQPGLNNSPPNSQTHDLNLVSIAITQ